MNLPRAIQGSSEERRSAWRGFSETMSEHLLCESGRAFRHRKAVQALENLLTIRQLDPLALARITKKRMPSMFGSTESSRKAWLRSQTRTR